MNAGSSRLRATLLGVVEALFRLLFTYECEGEELLPSVGGVVIAANHPSYLDPVLLSLQLRRPIRFMAWEGLFRVPLLGTLIRAFGAFPVNTTRGRGHEAYERARSLVEAGEVVGIFPEGKRSRTAWMEESLRLGATRLAWDTGAPLVPASIMGAYRAWPHYQTLPRPARIRVRFHEPIDPSPYRGLPEADALPRMLAELRRRVERSLLPGVKADLRRNVLWVKPAEFPRSYESLPVLALAAVVFWKTRSFVSVAPAYAYLGYLLADHFLLPQSRPVKWLRNASPVLFALGYSRVALPALGLPDVPAGWSLVALVLGGLFPYLYERGRTALDCIRGLSLACYLELLALWSSPVAVGPHLALPLFAAAFAWERRSVFWRWSVPVLLGYAVGVPALLGNLADLPLHGLAGLLAWLLVRLFPYHLAAPPADEPPAGAGVGLNL